MPALRAYLFLRWRLLVRLLVEVGWVRLGILLPMLVLSVGRGVVVAAGHPMGKWAVPVGVALLLASAHRQRADLRFLTISAPGYRRWLAVEYLLWGIPAAVVLVLFRPGEPREWVWYWHRWWRGCRRCARLPSTKHKARSLFRSEAFEWVSGLRAVGRGLAAAVGRCPVATCFAAGAGDGAGPVVAADYWPATGSPNP